MSNLLRGLLVGLLFGVPAGAVGALTIQRTCQSGVRAGLLTGLGSSVADCCYASVGAFGLTLVSGLLLQYQTAINLLGGGLILWLGIRLLRQGETAPQREERAAGLAGLFLSSFGVGITNPAAILTFLFAFSWFGISGGMELADGALLIVGVFLGTYLWWGTLTAATTLLMKKTVRFRLVRISRLFGILLCLFGATVFLRLVLP